MSGTPSTQVPGWYIHFQAAVIKQLPRPGEIDQFVAEGWDRNQKALKKVLAGCLLPTTAPLVPTEKFALLADLGTITVPEDYVHGTRLASFRAKYQDGEFKRFHFYNDALTDANFPNPSRILKHSDKLSVRAFRQIAVGMTTSEERMLFLQTEGAVFTGAQGASLVWEQKCKELPKGYWYSSFNKNERLSEVADGHHMVPDIGAGVDGTYHFHVGHLNLDQGVGVALLCFCEVE